MSKPTTTTPADERRAVIVDQIRRLGSCPGWRDCNQYARKELADTLEQVAVSPYHARATITLWLSENRWLPSPADIRSAAAAAPHSEPPKAIRSQCSLCAGSGRDSYWGLISTERWPNGEIKRRICERIPATPGRENMYLVERPAIEAHVDGQSQVVAMVSGYCCCEYGRHLATIQRGGAQ